VAIRDGLIERNAASLAKAPKAVKKEITAFTPDEARRFVAAARGHRLEALFTAAVAMATREGEALGLRVEDVDLERRVVRIHQAIQRAKLGPGQKSRLIVVTPKNDAMEAQVMARVFAHGVATSGTKPYTGHLLGSAGATELGFAWLALDESNARPRIDLPRHLWDGKADPALPRLDLVEDKRRLAGPSHVMSNSFAFGGSNASLILAG